MTDPYVGPVAHDSGTGNLPIIRIVVHCTVGADGTNAMSTVKYFKSEASRGSAHAVVDDNETLICAHDNVVCWHAPPNPHSLGVELCCSLTNKGLGHWDDADHIAMMKRGAKWVAEKCIKHNVPPVKLTVAQVKAGKKGICGHFDVSEAFGQTDHYDPGPYFPWPQFMGYVKAYYEALTNPVPDPETPKGWDEMATEAEVYAQSYKADYQYGIDFWIKGTGAALIKAIGAISEGTAANGRAIAALAAQVSAEDAADDDEFRTAMGKVEASQATLKAGQDALAVAVEALAAEEVPEPPKV